MTAIQLLACAGMIAGTFLILGLRPVEFADSLFAFFLQPTSSTHGRTSRSRCIFENPNEYY